MRNEIKIRLDRSIVELSIIYRNPSIESVAIEAGDEYIDVQTAAQIIGISKSKLYYLVGKHRINCFRKRHRIFFLRQYLSAYTGH